MNRREGNQQSWLLLNSNGEKELRLKWSGEWKQNVVEEKKAGGSVEYSPQTVQAQSIHSMFESSHRIIDASAMEIHLSCWFHWQVHLSSMSFTCQVSVEEKI